MAKISVFGIGYVGVVTAACLADDGNTVIAVDVEPSKVATVNGGKSPIVEDGLEPLIARGVADGRLRATLDAADAIINTDFSLVCVGTPSAADGSVGTKYVVEACRTIGRLMAEKTTRHTVVVRSTIVPGTMDSLCVPTLEQASGMVVGKDFGVGYFPEFLRESTAIADYYDQPDRIRRARRYDGGFSPMNGKMPIAPAACLARHG